MESYQFENIVVIPEKKGFGEFSKVSCPIRYGRYSEIQTPDYTFQFNYNSVFLGLHDALMSETGLIEFTALNAHRIFEFESSHLKGPRLFLFGSVDSLLNSGEDHEPASRLYLSDSAAVAERETPNAPYAFKSRRCGFAFPVRELSRRGNY